MSILYQCSKITAFVALSFSLILCSPPKSEGQNKYPPDTYAANLRQTLEQVNSYIDSLQNARFPAETDYSGQQSSIVQELQFIVARANTELTRYEEFKVQWEALANKDLNEGEKEVVRSQAQGMINRLHLWTKKSERPIQAAQELLRKRLPD